MRKLFLLLMVVAGMFSCSHPFGNHSGNEQVPPNWQNQDLQMDGVFGISTDRAYDQLLKNKNADTVIVAVIDSGIDTTQQELSPVLWTNPEDGTHGRNYIGPETGREDFIPMLENAKDDPGYGRTLADYNLHLGRLQTFMSQLKESKKILEQIINHIGKQSPSAGDLKKYQVRNEDERRILDLLWDRMPAYENFDKFKFCEVDNLLDLGEYHLEHGLNRDLKAQDIFWSAHGSGFNADISNDALGLVADPNVATEHGTYVSGIIAAVRNNGKGINGVADHARIMMLKLSNNIREMRNDDLARAIRFAVDHGARVINMSFGKTFSLHREEVDKAVQYAMSRDMLIVHSAGNDGTNLDVDSNSFFPSPRYLDGGVASAWLTVGASGYQDDSTLIAPFSNYGHKNVDVFAPGVQITSTIPHSKCECWSGTSQAAPVVTGLAALIMEYYPSLTAIQVKEVIMKTVVSRELLKYRCVSGGIVNAYNALELAAKYK